MNNLKTLETVELKTVDSFTLDRYFQIAQALTALEKEKKELREIIKTVYPDGGEYVATLINDKGEEEDVKFLIDVDDSSRSNFNLNRARSIVDEIEWQAKYAPFISVTEFKKIKVKKYINGSEIKLDD